MALTNVGLPPYVRRFRIRLACNGFVLALLALSIEVSQARATLCLSCDAQAVLPDCTPLRHGDIFPPELEPTVAAVCEETACSPPIPPEDQPTCGIQSRRVRADYFLLRASDGSSVEAEFVDSGSVCGEATLLRLTDRVPRGAYAVFTRVAGCFAHLDVQYVETTFVATDSTVTGDCNGDRGVTVDELLLGVSIALGPRSVQACRLLDADDDGAVAVTELLSAVANALATEL